MAWFLCCVFLCCSGGFQFRSKPDPLGAHHPPCQQPAAGEGAPREGARRPKQPPRQDQTWQSPCSRPGTGEGKLAGGRRPSWRGCGEPRWLRRASSSYPLPGSGQTERAWGTAGLGRQPVGGDSGVAPGAQKRGPPTAHALDPGLGLSGPAQPPAWENPGPLPGATALPGRAGEGIPGICPETAGASLGTTSPDMGSASVA